MSVCHTEVWSGDSCVARGSAGLQFDPLEQPDDEPVLAVGGPGAGAEDAESAEGHDADLTVPMMPGPGWKRRRTRHSASRVICSCFGAHLFISGGLLIVVHACQA